MQLFQQQTESELYPREDAEVKTLQAALQAARDRLTPVAQAWKTYCAEHCDETISIPFSRQKQRLYDRFCDASLDVDEAEIALQPVMAAAIQRAKALWDEKIRQEFLDDLPAIEAFIDLLARYERTVTEAELAGVSGVLDVGKTFLTADEVATRLVYAKQQ